MIVNLEVPNIFQGVLFFLRLSCLLQDHQASVFLLVDLHVTVSVSHVLHVARRSLSTITGLLWRRLTRVNLASFDKLAHHFLSVFVALQAHLEGNLLGIKVGVLIAITGSFCVVLKHACSRRAICACIVRPTLLLRFKLLKLSLHRLAHLVLDKVLVRGALPAGGIVPLSPLLLLVHVVGAD